MSCWSVQAVLAGAQEIEPIKPRFVLLVSCGQDKLKGENLLACEMYVGTYHAAARQYAASVCRGGQTFIVSAKYGLLDLFDRVDPYEVRMGQRGAIAPEIIAQQAQERGVAELPALVLGGAAYVDACRLAFPTLYAPTECMERGQRGIGKQLRWYRQNRGHLPEAFRELVRRVPERGPTRLESQLQLQL